jgi:hypothetical protein
MIFHQVNTRIDQPMEHEIHLGRRGRGEYHVPWVDQTLYSPKLKVINVLLYDIKSNLSQYCIEFIIIYCCKAPTLFPRHPCLPNICHY